MRLAVDGEGASHRSCTGSRTSKASSIIRHEAVGTNNKNRAAQAARGGHSQIGTESSR